MILSFKYSCAPGIAITTDGSDPYLASLNKHNRITIIEFEDGTSFSHRGGHFRMKNEFYGSMDELFLDLSKDVVETILFNLDFFRRL